jgi:hypothetical protein
VRHPSGAQLKGRLLSIIPINIKEGGKSKDLAERNAVAYFASASSEKKVVRPTLGRMRVAIF